MMRYTLLLPAALAALAMSSGAAAGRDDDEEIPFDEADIYFELNHTDGDLGIHALIDGDAWKRLQIEDPRGHKLLDIRVYGRLRKQGLTEIFFESAEPSFDELPPARFFARFPEGEYEVEGETLEGEELESTDVLMHVMPAPAGNITVNGTPSAENCDAADLPTVAEGEAVVIDWDPVTTSHPDVGRAGAVDIEKYEFFVEGGDPLLVFSVELPPDQTAFEIPEGFLELGDEFKFEILAVNADGNRTAIESCFVIE